MTAPAQDLAAPYEALAELAARELELAAAPNADRVDELAAIAAERAALIASLPERPPAAAAAGLARAAALQERTTAELLRLHATVGRALGELDRGRAVVRGYGSTLPPRGGQRWAG